MYQGEPLAHYLPAGELSPMTRIISDRLDPAPETPSEQQASARHMVPGGNDHHRLPLPGSPQLTGDLSLSPRVVRLRSKAHYLEGVGRPAKVNDGKRVRDADEHQRRGDTALHEFQRARQAIPVPGQQHYGVGARRRTHRRRDDHRSQERSPSEDFGGDERRPPQRSQPRYAGPLGVRATSGSGKVERREARLARPKAMSGTIKMII